MMKKITLTTLFLFFLYFITIGKVYYTSPRGTETDLSKVTRDNPADWRAITQGEMARRLQCGDSVLLRWDQGIYTEGTRIYATGCNDTYQGAIHYLSEPGGFAVFRINKYPQNNYRHIDRALNPNGIVIGGEVHWKNANQSDPMNGWNVRDVNNSTEGRYVWVREIVMQGNYGTNSPKRDLSRLNTPYGSTGRRDPGTLAGGQNYDNMTGFISIRAYGSRIINCVFWNLGHSGVGVNSMMRQGNATFYGNVVTNTGHSSPERDRFHSVYQQWGSFNKGRLIHKHSIFQFSAEEQLQIWAQSGINPATGESKVDHIDLIENVLINGGTLSGKKHPGRISPNSKIGGYTYDTDIRIIGNISWHDKGGQSWQSGFSLNGNNDRRNLYVKNNLLVGNGALFRNITSIKEVSGNTFVALNGTQLDFQIRTDQENGLLPQSSKWNNNSFYGGGNVHYSRWVRDHVRKSYDKISFKAWQNKGFDKNSTYSSESPNDMIKYFSNEYLQHYNSNWRGHVVVLNFSGQGKKHIDLGKFRLNEGDKFRIIDVQNIAGDLTGNYVYEGTYKQADRHVAIDMIDHNSSNVVKDPTGEMVGPFGTDRRFGTYLVIRVEQAAKQPNKMPVAKAGGDQRLTLPENSVVIDCSDSEDPDGIIVSYSCEKISGPNTFKIDNGNTDQPKISELAEGTYTFKLTVTDNSGASDQDEVKVFVNPELQENVAPTASAGSDQTLTLPDNSITLDGSGSFDENGNIESYSWEQTAGPSTADMEGQNTANLTVSDLRQGTYKFKLTVTDDHGNSTSDYMQLVVKSVQQSDQNDDDDTEQPDGQYVANFTLINADSNQPIAGYDPIPAGATINLQELPTKNLNIRANTDPYQIGSVMFSYGSQENFKTENLAPYAFQSDRDGNYRPWTPTPGDHSITATPFSESNRGGEKGTAFSLNITIVDKATQEEEEDTNSGPKVVNFTLINANTDQPIAAYDPIPEGATINLHDLPTSNLNVRANTDPYQVGSVMFSYGGQENFKTENVVPYAFQSDKDGNYHPWTPDLGGHSITATPFSISNRRGEKGAALTLNITIVDEAPQEEEEEPVVIEEPEEEEEEEQEEDTNSGPKVVNFTLINANTDQPIAAYDPIPEGATINLYDLPTSNLNVRANTDPYEVGSVMFSYGGQENLRTENVVPYAFHSDKDGDYHPWKPKLGDHSITATPFSLRNRKGEKGTALTLNITIINEAPQTQEENEEEVTDLPWVVSYTLIDADKNQPIAAYDPIPEGSTINLQELPTLNLNIRANIAPNEVGSVTFSYNGRQSFRTENKVPYALHSDTEGNYKAWKPDLGNHSVTATPYSETYGRGEAGTPLTLNFTVDSFIPMTSLGADIGAAKKYMIYPNPNKGVFELEPADKEVKILSVAIYDSFGNKVYDKDYNKYFDVEHFALGLVKSGLYKIIVTTEKSVDYVRMIVEF